jgi:uncharacterized RDD family membrane protein YckC
MADEEQGVRDSTDLIDVSDVAAQFDEVTPTSERMEAAEGISESSLEPQMVEGPTIASLKDRLAAFLLDATVLYIAYWVLMLIYRSVALEKMAGPVPAWGIHGLIFHGLFLFLAFLYFLLFESVLYATPGKLLCRLTIRSADGNPPTISQCFTRNLLRPIDIILMPVLIPAACMELTGHRLRIGDLAGRTLVIRKFSKSRRQYSLTIDMLASATGRMIALLIDLLLFAAFIIGYGLLLTPEQPIFSMMLVVLLPIVCMIYFFVPEACIKTSLGKWLFGYTITNEDGSTLDVTGALTRTIFRPFDYNPFGFLMMYLSIRRQRAGDVAAGTVLCKVPRRWSALIGIGITVAVVFSVLYAGLSNRSSFLTGSFRINFLPAFEVRSVKKQPTPRDLGLLNIKEFNFAGNTPEELRRPPIFKAGETVYIVFMVNGGKEKFGKVWIQEDLIVRYPDGNIGLKLDNIIDFHEAVPAQGLIELTNNMALPPDAMPGRYTVSLIVRDKHTGRQINEQHFFYVQK